MSTRFTTGNDLFPRESRVHRDSSTVAACLSTFPFPSHDQIAEEHGCMHDRAIITNPMATL
jgi:hypothetical protein